jgi:CubicO group peptidase (beta-lactamase class C family)
MVFGKMPGWRVLAVVLALGAMAHAAADSSHPKTLAELQRSLHQIAAKDHMPGAGIALVANGRLLWCGGIGKADIAAKREVSCDTQFRVGSESKTFVALALMKLMEEGKLDLHAKLHDIAPEIPLKNPWEATNPVRVEDVLEHTAGFDDAMFSEPYSKSSAVETPVLDVLRKFPKPFEVRWPPGTRMSYSNSGYTAAGYLIEKLSHRPWQDYIRQEILIPLGIATGDYALTPANRALLAQGYNENAKPALPYKYLYMAPAGEMKASPREMAKLVQFFLDRGVAGGKRLLKPETIARMEWPQKPLSVCNGLRLGYGFGNYTDTGGDVLTHGHNGGLDGFVSNFRYSPEENWGFVVLENSDGTGGAIYEMSYVITQFLSKDFAHSKLPVVKMSDSDLQKFAGFYELQSPRHQNVAFLDKLLNPQSVRVEGGKLVIHDLFGGSETLLPVGKNLFRHSWDPEATVAFFPNQDGTMSLVDGSYFERTSPVWPITKLGLLALSLVLMASSVLFAPIWLLRWVFGFMKGVRHIWVRAVPLLAIATLGAVFALLANGQDQLTQMSLISELVFVCTILFALLSFAGLWLALRIPRGEMNGVARLHALLVSAACCTLTLFMASWHLIGLRLWAI